ncbi:OsmC family protein [Neobacillus cucumis]|uniref:OsmC family protein n=1 Tax=Neobacillus cucumis TaxID=1740721 RepID=UPI0018DF3DCE|nr:OsmC family protein [Neobacillus cucumis]MBI0577165.1 OsmC family protein [Neobacillus cucumis]WHY94222.1 OsmC family protein [Neobacillus cucumis]
MGSSRFSVNGSWQGDRNGTGHIQAAGLDITASVPKEFDGPGIGSSPEELLIAASNNCYMITLAAMISNRKIEGVSFEVVSEGIVDKIDGKLKFKQINHKPTIYINPDAEVTVEKLEELAVRAEKACFISNTLRCSIEFSVQPKVIVK